MFPKTLLDLNSILSEKGIKIKIETNPIQLPNNPFYNNLLGMFGFHINLIFFNTLKHIILDVLM